MLTYNEAIKLLLQDLSPLTAVEVSLYEALGQVLAEPVHSRWDLPTADNSAMDGYAFSFKGQRAGDDLTVAGFIPAGAPFAGKMVDGQAIKIMTGGVLPPECDTVVPIEEVVESGASIRLSESPAERQHVRRRGEEIGKGETLLAPGTAIHAGEMGLLAAAGAERVRVHPRLRVALLSTGDELVELGTAPGPGQIVNSNFHMLSARLREEGCTVIPLGIARDNETVTAERIREGLKADLLITTGGVSVGDRDYVQDALRAHGFELGFWRVAIKPGKPVLFGTAQGTPVLGLPGNPAASAATFELFVRPALRRLAGHRDALAPRMRVTLTAAVTGDSKRQSFLWGSLREEAGAYLFTPSSWQGSGQTRSIQAATALLPVPAASEGFPAGSEVEVLLLRLPPGISDPA
ncbi:MAG: molybdopterin molybdotransferase MoeA [Desulfuromonadales bacterium]|jgi:molybdopterin molybdotransferase|nr:molybdopterin molybdotransferase MoeA [Desulfuromonadales bacterium]